MKKIIKVAIFTLILTFAASVAVAQHCPFDGGMVVVIHLTDEKGEAFTDAENIKLVQKNKKQGENFIAKSFLPTKENLMKVYGERTFEVYSELACDEDCKIYGEGMFVAHLTMSEAKKNFEIQITHGNGQIRKIDVDRDNIFSLCYNRSKWSDAVPMEINELRPLQKPLEISEYDGKDCFRYGLNDNTVIRNNAEFLKSVRNDMSRERCLKDLEKIDFDKHNLVNIEINSGYCRYPLGLKYNAYELPDFKRYIFEISYIKPIETCAALSRFPLRLLVPKIPVAYEITTKISAYEKNSDPF